MSERVLIIDDEENICTVLSAFFEEAGYVPATAMSLEVAREELKKTPLPDMILLDVMLPDGNGLIFLRELKRAAVTEHIPVIMMSALRNRGQDRVAGLEYGADDYLGKPFDLQELKIRMDRILKQKKKTAPTVSPDFSATPLISPSSVQAFDQLDLTEDESENSQLGLRDWIGFLLLHPGIFFRRVASDSSYKLSWFCLIGTALGFGLQIGIQDKGFSGALVGSAAYFVGFAGITAVLSWILQWVMGLKQISVKFSEIWLFFRLSFAPAAIAGILGVIYVAISGGRLGELTAGPLLLLPSQASSNTLGYILRRCDFFELWSVHLLASGLHTIFKTKKRFMLLWVFGGWILLVSGYGIIRGFF